jgi:type I restriction enzyme M protein
MLDDVTKKRINSLRQILVGKLPDPKAQVEQITNGLIYKFMNDMDEQSVSMGGKSTYFSGKFQRFSWKNLMDTKTSGVEKIKLYSDAIEQMYTNENLPELFREIFKNSFLPFKDPSTLNKFLKEINEFNYSNSEKLGDAFEYLLSFMGSQGDAGQFRTPRHIIDFIVEIVNPQKNETILDPACGTAGFLISSYKHILKQNTKKNLGDGLTVSDRKKIGENLNGYDISPDMVKMSLVNMYLHKFTNPKINEYDTLSSEDRWNEYYGVILANPPFFSPKGGITPHNRFGVNSTKAEVLFVDYINEHLKPKGRAGIIVPEGIIFQTGTAYKQLRKRLIETSLVGIISLPAGVFQPYSGVKTSILILDKEKNKKNNDVFFANVVNDGFSLGAQRNKIKENDIPQILDFIKNNKESKNCFLVDKSKILSDENFIFSSTKYSITKKIDSKFKLIKIIDTFKVLTPKIKINSKNFLKEGKIPIIDQSKKFIAGYWNNIEDKIEISKPVIIFGDHTKIIKYIDFDFVAGADGIKILQPNSNILPKYLYFIIKSLDIADLGYSRHFKELKEKKIPLPSLQIQNQIVKELDRYQKIIEGNKRIIEKFTQKIKDRINKIWSN